MKEPPRILDDSRPIAYIRSDIKDPPDYYVGYSGVTEIVAYGELGPHCPLPWLAVYKGDRVHVRLPAGMVEIFYGEPTGQEGGS